MDVRNDVVPIADVGICSHVGVDRQNEQSVVAGGLSRLMSALRSEIGRAMRCDTAAGLKWW